jgi:hypothetical protein
MLNHVPSEALTTEVAGPGVAESQLAAVLAESRKLLVFLRHFG